MAFGRVRASAADQAHGLQPVGHWISRSNPQSPRATQNSILLEGAESDPHGNKGGDGAEQRCCPTMPAANHIATHHCMPDDKSTPAARLA